MIKARSKKQLTVRRIRRIRAKINGVATCPRLVVNKTNYAMYAQLIDDQKAKTILSVKIKGKNMKVARDLGSAVAKKASARKITRVVFDRRGSRYHGAVKAVAEAAREGGLRI
jgi:large subunit ribosomal protein L18